MQQDRFLGNRIISVGRSGTPLQIEEFLNDMQNVFEKHGVNRISNGDLWIDENVLKMHGTDFDIADYENNQHSLFLD